MHSQTSESAQPWLPERILIKQRYRGCSSNYYRPPKSRSQPPGLSVTAERREIYLFNSTVVLAPDSSILPSGQRSQEARETILSSASEGCSRRGFFYLSRLSPVSLIKRLACGSRGGTYFKISATELPELSSAGITCVNSPNRCINGVKKGFKQSGFLPLSLN